jgi:DNA-binding response OmpR family regulator
MRILLVEDDVALRDGLHQALTVQGFAVNAVGRGEQALSVVRSGDCDCLILDLGLPDMDGLSVLKQLRQKWPRLPVLILTARDSLDDRISGLDLGADDYLVKPFAAAELFARLRVIERRLGTAATHLVRIAGVELDTSAMQLNINGQQTGLSRREYVLLKELMESAGRVKTREQLEASLYSWGEEVASNALEVHISNLRKKLPADFIRTVRGVGYSIAKS